MELISRHAQHILFQMRVLYRVFFLRVIDLEILSAEGDSSRLMGQFAAVFVSISFFCSFPVPLLIYGHSAIPMDAAYSFEHFLIETTMTIAGIVTVLGWDSAFPDRRDMLVLGPLPVHPATLFFSKLAALFAGPLLAGAAFNLCNGFSWPMVFAREASGSLSLLRTFPAYWLTMFAGASFCVLSVLAIQGLAMNLLPRQLYLRLSAVLQAALLCLLLTTYFLGPSLSTRAELLAEGNQQALRWLPAYWFVGLFNQLNGTLRVEMVPLAKRAGVALAVATGAALVALLLSYLRTLRRVVEQPEIMPAMRSASFGFGSSIDAALTLFSLRTILRSRLHRMILSVYVGIGLTIIFGFLHTRFANTGSRFETAAAAPSPLSVMYLLASILTVVLSVLALRIVVSLPITLRANWVFRLTQLRPAWRYHRAVRTSFFALCVIPVLVLLSTGLLRRGYPAWAVGEHLLVMALLGALMVELCLFTFRKICFACSYLPGKANLHFVFWIALLGSIRWIHDAAESEGGVLGQPLRLLGLLLVMGAAVSAAHMLSSRRAGEKEELLFEEEDLQQMVTLKLR